MIGRHLHLNLVKQGVQGQPLPILDEIIADQGRGLPAALQIFAMARRTLLVIYGKALLRLAGGVDSVRRR